mmetsp:Transcript_14948/g.41415  ORF Transcript_14948/g.41415 Transcript_14948/m.41415 type:complete len:327 (+) Transcript_14948:101-1081(+)
MLHLQQLQKVRTSWNDGIMIQQWMRGVVMRLDVVHFHRLLHTRHLVNLATVVQHGRRLRHAARVRLEVHGVHFIEPHQRREQPDVRLREDVARDVALLLQDTIDTIERLRQFFNGRVVRFLRLGESATVNAVVETWIDPRVDGIDRVLQMRRIEVGAISLGVEFRIQHAHDIGRLVADDGLAVRVPQDGDRVLAFRVAGAFVDLAHRFGVSGIIEHPAAMVIGSSLLPGGEHGRDADVVLQSLQSAHDHRAMRPRAGVRDVQVVSSRFGWQIGVFADPVAPHRITTLEFTLFARLVQRGACHAGRKQLLGITHRCQRLHRGGDSRP